LKLDDVLFFFVRHGETPDNKKQAYRSWSNSAEAQLSSEGRKAADEAGRYLKAVGANIELMIADSLDRVQETVEIIAKNFPEAQLQFVRSLHPLNMGDYTGKSKKDHPVDSFLKDKSKRIPGGETVAEFDKRQSEIFTSIFGVIKDFPRGRVLIGGHGSNVSYLYDQIFHPGQESPGYEGLVNPGGIIAATPKGLIPLTRVRGGKGGEKRGIIKEDNSLPTYPPDHQVGMKVPKGGSDCEKCEYLAANQTDCTNEAWLAWRKKQGAAKPEEIPEKIDEYCCDFFSTGEKE
jgi:broad specificity phosphatase PhoE